MLKKLSVALCVASVFGVGVAQANELVNSDVPLTQTFTVDFQAEVKAGTCSFSVSSTKGVLDAEGVLNVNLGTVRKDGTTAGKYADLMFNLTACADSVFSTVEIKGDKTAVINTERRGYVKFYSDQNETPWDPSTEVISWDREDDIGNQTNVSETKYVRFEQDENTSLGTHTASIVFTATYQ